MSASFPEIVQTLEQRHVDAYGRVNGDRNRIHYDADVARAEGFDGPIVHGALVAAILMRACTGAFGLDWMTRGTMWVRFQGPCIVGETIRTGGQLPPSDALDREVRETWAVWCETTSGRRLITGEARGIVRLDAAG